MSSGVPKPHRKLLIACEEVEFNLSVLRKVQLSDWSFFVSQLFEQARELAGQDNSLPSPPTPPEPVPDVEVAERAVAAIKTWVLDASPALRRVVEETRAFGKRLAKSELEFDKRIRELLSQLVGVDPGYGSWFPAVMEFFASEYGWSPDKIAGLSNYQMEMYLRAALNRRAARHGPSQGHGAASAPSQPVSEPPADGGANRGVPPGFETRWPFDMRANLADRRVWRNGIMADLGTNKPAWEMLCKLAKNHPSRSPAETLRSGDTEKGSVYTAASELRCLLAPLNVGIESLRTVGYLLVNLNPQP
jgi:hypothetical protein